MPKTRKSHPPSLKAKVAVEAIKAHKTAAQIAQMFGVHPTHEQRQGYFNRLKPYKNPNLRTCTCIDEGAMYIEKMRNGTYR